MSNLKQPGKKSSSKVVELLLRAKAAASSGPFGCKFQSETYRICRLPGQFDMSRLVSHNNDNVEQYHTIPKILVITVLSFMYACR